MKSKSFGISAASTAIISACVSNPSSRLVEKLKAAEARGIDPSRCIAVLEETRENILLLRPELLGEEDLAFDMHLLSKTEDGVKKDGLAGMINRTDESGIIDEEPDLIADSSRVFSGQAFMDEYGFEPVLIFNDEQRRYLKGEYRRAIREISKISFDDDCLQAPDIEIDQNLLPKIKKPELRSF